MAMKNGGDTREVGQMAQRAWGGAGFCHDIQIADPWIPLSQAAVSAPFDLCLSHPLDIRGRSRQTWSELCIPVLLD